MKRVPRIFVDSDVIISSLLSSKGAAYLLIHSNVPRFISDRSYQELVKVSKRLNLPHDTLSKLIKKRFTTTPLDMSLSTIKKIYSVYTTDPNDAHIVAAAFKANVKFLITYNTKHFRVDKIKQDFAIITYKPATFLQYLRSINLP